MEISVIVPIYNVENYLSECLESVLNQKFNGLIEVICINDGSKDNCLEIIREYQKNYPNIVLIDQENKGLSAARNAGLKKAKGKYVMFIDSDDYLKHKNVLYNLYEAIEKDNLDIVSGQFEYSYVDENSNKIQSDYLETQNVVMTGQIFFDVNFSKGTMMSVVWNKLYRKEFLLKNNLFFIEGILYEDMEFTPKAFYLAKRVKALDDVIYMYRQRENSITSCENLKSIEDYIIIAEELSKFNANYKSKSLLKLELYLYVQFYQKQKYIAPELKKQLIEKINNKSIIKKFFTIKDVKYFLYGIFLLESTFLTIKQRKKFN